MSCSLQESQVEFGILPSPTSCPFFFLHQVGRLLGIILSSPTHSAPSHQHLQGSLSRLSKLSLPFRPLGLQCALGWGQPPMWPTDQIQPNACFFQYSFAGASWPYSCVYVLLTCAFIPQWQSSTVATETARPMKLKNIYYLALCRLCRPLGVRGYRIPLRNAQ